MLALLAILAAAAAAAGLVDSEGASAQAGRPQPQVETFALTRDADVRPRTTVTVNLGCPVHRGMFPVSFGFRTLTQLSGLNALGLELVEATPVRSGAGVSGFRVRFRNPNNQTVSGRVIVICMDGSRGFRTGVRGGGGRAFAARDALASAQEGPGLEQYAARASARVRPGRTERLTALCDRDPNTALADFGFDVQDATLLGAKPIKRGGRVGYQGSFRNSGGRAETVELSALCLEGEELGISVDFAEQEQAEASEPRAEASDDGDTFNADCTTIQPPPLHGQVGTITFDYPDTFIRPGTKVGGVNDQGRTTKDPFVVRGPKGVKAQIFRAGEQGNLFDGLNYVGKKDGPPRTQLGKFVIRFHYNQQTITLHCKVRIIHADAGVLETLQSQTDGIPDEGKEVTAECPEEGSPRASASAGSESSVVPLSLGTYGASQPTHWRERYPLADESGEWGGTLHRVQPAAAGSSARAAGSSPATFFQHCVEILGAKVDLDFDEGEVLPPEDGTGDDGDGSGGGGGTMPEGPFIDQASPNGTGKTLIAFLLVLFDAEGEPTIFGAIDTQNSASPQDTDGGAHDLYRFDAKPLPGASSSSSGARLGPRAVGPGVTLTLLSTGPTGGSGAFDAAFKAASADGSRVFFDTKEALTASDSDGALDIYERSGDTTTHISQGATTADVFFGSISTDGSKAFFGSENQLAGSDTDSATDVYERFGGTTTHVSQGQINGNGNSQALFKGSSADGSRVFFDSTEQLTTNDTDFVADIYERSGGATTRVSQGQVNGNGAHAATFLGASADGTRVFFETNEQLTSDDADASKDLYERSGGTTALLSTGPTGGNGAFAPTYKGISTDGSRVFFETNEQLTGVDTDSSKDVYERSGGTTTLVSVGNGAFDATLVGATADGTRAIFETAEPLVASDTDASTDVYERAGGTTTLVSAGQINGNGAHDAFFAGALGTRFPGMSADGSRLFFATQEQLTSDDTDAVTDLYERFGGQTTRISFGETGGNGAFDVFGPFATSPTARPSPSRPSSRLRAPTRTGPSMRTSSDAPEARAVGWRKGARPRCR